MQPLQDRNAAAVAIAQHKHQNVLLQWQEEYDLAVQEWESLRVQHPAACSQRVTLVLNSMRMLTAMHASCETNHPMPSF